MKVKVLVQLAVILALLSPNSKSLLVEKARAEEPIKIGVTFPITGALSLYGEGFKNGVELAEAEINEGGGDDGRRLEIIVADNQSDPKVAISDAKRFFDADTVSGMLSGFDFLTLPIVPILEKKKGVLLSTTVYRFPEGQIPKFTFTGFWNPETVGKRYGSIANRKGLQRVGLIAIEDRSYSLFRRGFDATFTGVAIAEERFLSGEKDVRSLLLRVNQKKPDSLVVWGYPEDTANILKSMALLRMDDVPLFIMEGTEEEVVRANHDLLQSTGAITLASGRLIGEKHRSFVDAYRARFIKEPRLESLISYDLTHILFSAASACPPR